MLKFVNIIGKLLCVYCLTSFVQAVEKEDEKFEIYNRTFQFLEKENSSDLSYQASMVKSHLNRIEKNLKNESSETKAMIFALSFGDFETANLLKNKANMNPTSSPNDTILEYTQVDDRWLPHQIRWFHKNNINLDCIMLINERPGGVPIVLLDCRMYIEYIAFANNNKASVLTLIQLKPELLNKRNSYTGQTVLFSALHDTNLLHALINAGADLDVLDNEGKSPLIKATTSGDYERALILISYGAKTDIPFQDKLYYLSNEKEKEIIYDNILDFLMRSPRSLNEDKNNKISPALRRSKESIISLLKKLR
jgi:ankyrin repeat protein